MYPHKMASKADVLKRYFADGQKKKKKKKHEDHVMQIRDATAV